MTRSLLWGLITGFAVATVLYFTFKSQGATVDITKLDDDHVLIVFEGSIRPGDATRISDAVNVARYHHYEVTALEMLSFGGDGDAGIAIARYVANHKMWVYAPTDCYSACAFAALVALGSRRLFISNDTRLGLHVVTRTDTGKADRAWTRWAADELIELGGSSAPLDMMARLPLNQMNVLDHNDLLVLGARMPSW